VIVARRPLRAVSAEEAETFERDGYVVLRRVLAPAWLASLEEVVERILASPRVRDVTEEAVRAVHANPETLFGAAPYASTLEGRGHFRVSLNNARREPDLLRFVLRGALGSIVATLLRSSSVRFCDDVLLVKEPHTREETEWHDDDPYSLASGPQRCSLWCSLDDVPADAGALRFVRSSHRHFSDWRRRGLDAEALAAEHRDDVVVCPVHTGDVVAHHPATIHSAGPNGTGHRRRAFALRFAGEKARFVLPPVRREPRELYGLADGEPLVGSLFPLAWPAVTHCRE
jgi:ectoine hydroxylase-related dioxygenase (phytanoyl-CoA dioxygenase family)